VLEGSPRQALREWAQPGAAAHGVLKSAPARAGVHTASIAASQHRCDLSVKVFVAHGKVNNAVLYDHMEGAVVVAVRMLSVLGSINLFQNCARHLLEIAAVPGVLAEDNRAPRNEAVDDARRDHRLVLLPQQNAPGGFVQD